MTLYFLVLPFLLEGAILLWGGLFFHWRYINWRNVQVHCNLLLMGVTGAVVMDENYITNLHRFSVDSLTFVELSEGGEVLVTPTLPKVLNQ